MTYVLENVAEGKRLEKQSMLPGYALVNELRFLRLLPGQKILDAGCGTGLVARYVCEHFNGVAVEACDISAIRLKQAQGLSTLPQHHRISYFESSLDQLKDGRNPLDCAYDTVIYRYVFEHLMNHEDVVRECHRVLRPGGVAYVVNFDGIIFNLNHGNDELSRMMTKLKKDLPLDLYIGRKIPDLLYKAGFEDVQWDVEAVGFGGDALVEEEKQMRQRLGFAMPVLTSIFGSKAEGEKFIDLFCSEMMKPGSTLFYNKFIVRGRKSSGKPTLIQSVR